MKTNIIEQSNTLFFNVAERKCQHKREKARPDIEIPYARYGHLTHCLISALVYWYRPVLIAQALA